MLQPDLILASASPRRRELLERIGLCFSVEAAEAEENLIPGLSAGNQVMRLSRIKADAVAYRHPEEPVILSADTVVVLDGAILGKPSDEEDARKMLRALSGRTHHVLTGVTVKKGRYQETRCEDTEVRFESLSEQEISAYIATGEPMEFRDLLPYLSPASPEIITMSWDFPFILARQCCVKPESLYWRHYEKLFFNSDPRGYRHCSSVRADYDGLYYSESWKSISHE